MNERFRQGTRFLQEAVQQSLENRDDDMQLKGFTSAAGISLRRIQAKLDLFRERMSAPGTSLTKAEQTVYSQLVELESEIEAEFDHYWRSAGVDWRPRKPVAKAVRRPASPE